MIASPRLGSHKGKAVRRAIRRLFFLPKYSSDLNPIKQFFATLTHWLRKTASRTVETVCNAIGTILDRITADQRSNYFANSGYDRK